MHFAWLMTTSILLISFCDNGNVKGNNIELQAKLKLQEMTDLKEHLESLQKDIEWYISSFLNNNDLTKLNSMVLAFTQDKVHRINIKKKIESLEKAYGQQLEYLATTIENIDRLIESRILAMANATEVSFRSKLEETVSTIEQKFTGSMSKLNETLGKLYEQVNQRRVPKQVDGGWTAWGSWTSCTSTCGKGINNRVRTCTNPAPSDGGNYCVGFGMEYNECQVSSCKAMPYCEIGWEEYQGSCYFFVHKISESKSWSDAEKFCGSSDSHLLRIDNQMEFEFIQNVLLELHGKQLNEGVTLLSGYWTGANDIRNEGQWVWSPRHANMRFTVWIQGEPNAKDSVENCGELSRFKYFKMNDLNCVRKLYFICEKLLLR